MTLQVQFEELKREKWQKERVLSLLKTECEQLQGPPRPRDFNADVRTSEMWARYHKWHKEYAESEIGEAEAKMGEAMQEIRPLEYEVENLRRKLENGGWFFRNERERQLAHAEAGLENARTEHQHWKAKFGELNAPRRLRLAVLHTRQEFVELEIAALNRAITKLFDDDVAARITGED